MSSFPLKDVAADGSLHRRLQRIAAQSERAFPAGNEDDGRRGAVLEAVDLRRQVLGRALLDIDDGIFLVGAGDAPERLTGVYQNLILKDGYGPLEGMKLPPIVTFAFVCRYVSGEASATEESEDACWVTPEEAAGMVTHPLYVQRLSDMLKSNDCVVFSSYEHDNINTVFKESVQL